MTFRCLMKDSFETKITFNLQDSKCLDLQLFQDYINVFCFNTAVDNS